MCVCVPSGAGLNCGGVSQMMRNFPPWDFSTNREMSMAFKHLGRITLIEINFVAIMLE